MKFGCAAQEFLIYVLAAFLLTWSEPLRTMEFQDLVMYLQASASVFNDGFSISISVGLRRIFFMSVDYLAWSISCSKPRLASCIALCQLKA